MFIDLIRFDNDRLTIEAGRTESECMASQSLDLPAHGFKDLYPVLLQNRTAIEQHLQRATCARLLKFEFPDGELPITEL